MEKNMDKEMQTGILQYVVHKESSRGYSYSYTGVSTTKL